MSVKLLVIVTIVFKLYPSTYCLMQSSFAIYSNFYFFYHKLELQPLMNKDQYRSDTVWALVSTSNRLMHVKCEFEHHQRLWLFSWARDAILFAKY